MFFFFFEFIKENFRKFLKYLLNFRNTVWVSLCAGIYFHVQVSTCCCILSNIRITTIHRNQIQRTTHTKMETESASIKIGGLLPLIFCYCFCFSIIYHCCCRCKYYMISVVPWWFFVFSFFLAAVVSLFCFVLFCSVSLFRVNHVPLYMYACV